MKYTKKRRRSVKKTTKRITLSRRGKKRGGEFSFFKKSTQPIQPIQPIQPTQPIQPIQPHCITSVSCPKNNLIKLSKMINESNENNTLDTTKKLFDSYNNVLSNMYYVKTKKDLGEVLNIIRYDDLLLGFFAIKNSKDKFIYQEQFFDSVQVPNITPAILRSTFDKMMINRYSVDPEKKYNLAREAAEEVARRAAKKDPERIALARRQARKGSVVVRPQ